MPFHSFRASSSSFFSVFTASAKMTSYQFEIDDHSNERVSVLKKKKIKQRVTEKGAVHNQFTVTRIKNFYVIHCVIAPFVPLSKIVTGCRHQLTHIIRVHNMQSDREKLNRVDLPVVDNKLTSFVCNHIDSVMEEEASGEEKRRKKEKKKKLLLLYNAFVQMMKQDKTKRKIMLLASMSIQRIQAEMMIRV